ncbi:probable LRR receptor-like serine/threonine-protein kinase At1g06840 isoform X4 [Coffea arabica]|uniref:non-specific serine/threonine protein kinase n=1 Tax=Coffea arabica TaxID=13443 RepID=A0A6P6UWK1_COFAR
MLDNCGQMNFLGITSMPCSRVSILGVSAIAGLFWALLLAGADGQVTDPTEVRALQAIKLNLIDPNGILSGWSRGDPCVSNWRGVLCFDRQVANGYHHVRELHLLNLNLSGSLSAEVGRLAYLRILDVMWNAIGGSIPKEIGNMTNLELLLLSGNQFTGSLPEEIGYLENLERIQIDQNQISGQLPKSFSNLKVAKHLHMNNNSLSGQIPPELSRVPSLVHLLLGNNNLSGYLPPDFSLLPNLLILQVDNNNFSGTSIPGTYKNLSHVLKMSFRNCSLQGPIPDLSNMVNLLYIDFSFNGLSGFMPQSNISGNITTIDLSHNDLSGTIPMNLSGLPYLQRLSLANNLYNGSVPSIIWPNTTMTGNEALTIDLQNNRFLNVSSRLILPSNVTMRLKGNPMCANVTLTKFCGTEDEDAGNIVNSTNSSFCRPQACPAPYEFAPASPVPCLCALPLYVGYRLKSPVISPSASGLSKAAIGGIVSGAIATAAILCACMLWLILKFRKRKHHAVSKGHNLSKISVKIDGVKKFSYKEMALATNNFDSSSQVGQGGYGKVFKGILADGNIVAIKRAQVGSMQGEKEFLTEIELLSRLHHRNLVSLIGYCDEEGEQMLVYEFLSDGTLRDHLSGKSKEPLSFTMRLRIALGSAKGILYLHTEANPPIFHRDIKATNILLDSGFTAKVADFGLSRLAPIPDLEGTAPAYVSTVVKGTPGYVDPDYFLTRKLTDKSDVYSLGVVFLELLTGMPPIVHGKNIVREVKDAYSSGRMISVIDKHIGSHLPDCVEKFMTLALKCCEEETGARPSMAEVVRELEDIWLLMPEPEAKLAESSATSPGGYAILSSSAATRNPHTSSDDSLGRDPGSEVISTLTPR